MWYGSLDTKMEFTSTADMTDKQIYLCVRCNNFKRESHMREQK